jgi:Family of unknown function (DUF5995)
MLQLLDGWAATGDGRCAFLECYSMMTASMRSALATGEFLDPPWVDQLLEHFAVRYFDAVDAFERDGSGPRPWVVAFTAASDPDRPVLQQLLLGINAHINHDLVLVLVDLLDGVWIDGGVELQSRRRQDFEEVNRVIARTVDQVQDGVVERRSAAMRVLDVVLGPVDEWTAGRLLNRWRARVWTDACSILSNPDPGTRAAQVAEVERRATRRAQRLLLGPSY